MLKNFFYISLIVAIVDVIAFFYLQSSSYKLSHTQWFAGFSQTITTLATLAALVVWWIVYFILTKDFANIWLPIILLLVVAGYFINDKIQIKVKENQEKADKQAWLTKATNLAH